MNEDKIYQFFQNQLSASDWEAFIALWKDDAGFRAKVLDYQVIYDGLEGMSVDQLRSKIEEWKQEMIEPSSVGSDIQEDTEPLDEETQSEPKFQQSDLSLTEKMEDFDIVKQGFRGLRYEKMRAKVQEWAEEESQPSGIFKLISTKSFIRIAASLLIIIIAGLFWWSNNNSAQSNNLLSFAENSYVPPADFSNRSSASSTILSDARLEAEQGNLSRAHQLLNTIPANDSLFILSLYYKGHVFYQMQEYEQSRDVFEILSQETKSKEIPIKGINLDNAGWTLLLCNFHLYAENGLSKEETSALQSDIKAFLDQSNPQDDYHQKALKFKDNLD